MSHGVRSCLLAGLRRCQRYRVRYCCGDYSCQRIVKFFKEISVFSGGSVQAKRMHLQLDCRREALAPCARALPYGFDSWVSTGLCPSLTPAQSEGYHSLTQPSWQGGFSAAPNLNLNRFKPVHSLFTLHFDAVISCSNLAPSYRCTMKLFDKVNDACLSTSSRASPRGVGTLQWLALRHRPLPTENMNLTHLHTQIHLK